VPGRLVLIVLPTEQCNFRCTYCFEDDLPPRRMSPATVRGLERWLDSRAPSLETLTLHWYGGEPLLAADVVERVQDHASQLSEAGARFRLRAAMTTNGYLLRPSLLARLVDSGISVYQIALDGTREHHDRTRVRAGGQGTFDRIWRNLLAARGLDRRFRVIVRVHVGRDNRDDARRLLDRFRDSFGGDGRFAIVLRKLFRCGGRSEDCDDVLPFDEATETMASLRDYAETLGLAGPVSATGDRCLAPLPYTFVVRADGTLQKCPVTPSHPANTIGRLHEDGRVSLDADRIRPWLRGLASGDEAELACPARGLTF